MQTFSLLDLAPVTETETPAQALANAADLARHAERLGYHRYWLAEHHNMPGIASAATAVVIGHVAQATSTIRVGAGGIMLPNHAPLVVAEQFGTLDALHPGRIDLGLGRAPGTDGATAQALRRYHQSADAFPQDVAELISYFDDDEGKGPVRAVPGMGSHLPVWILGSSTFGAQLAAYLGLPYAFASHFAPQMLEPAIQAYREGFRPSERLDKPYFMMAAGLHAADTDEEARYHRSSQILSFARLRTGTPGRLSRPVENVADHVPASAIAGAEVALSVSATGSPHTVRRQLREIIDRYQPDELMLTGMMFDVDARKRSFEIGAEVLSDMKTPAMT